MKKSVVCGAAVLVGLAGAKEGHGALVGVSVVQNSYAEGHNYSLYPTFAIRASITTPTGSASQSYSGSSGQASCAMTGSFSASAGSLSVASTGSVSATFSRAWGNVDISTVTTFAVDATQDYDFSFRTRMAPTLGYFDQGFTLKANGTTILSGRLVSALPMTTGLVDLSPPGSQNLSNDLYGADSRLSLVVGTTYTLTFDAASTGDSYSPANVTTLSASLTAVPEPATGTLAACAGAAAACARRRRR